MTKINLSKRQIKNAYRLGGIELMIPWPAGLGPEPDVDLGHEADATPAEDAAARAALQETCDAHDLVVVRVRVARVKADPRERHPEKWERVHLAVHIVAGRWKNVTKDKRGTVMWWAP